jgi:hypothetical protein
MYLTNSGTKLHNFDPIFYYLIAMTKLTLEQHEFDVLKAMIAERLSKLEKTITKNSDKLDEYESDIRNYTTYDLHRKLQEAN